MLEAPGCDGKQGWGGPLITPVAMCIHRDQRKLRTGPRKDLAVVKSCDFRLLVVFIVDARLIGRTICSVRTRACGEEVFGKPG